MNFNSWIAVTILIVAGCKQKASSNASSVKSSDEVCTYEDLEAQRIQSQISELDIEINQMNKEIASKSSSTSNSASIGDSLNSTNAENQDQFALTNNAKKAHNVSLSDTSASSNPQQRLEQLIAERNQLQKDLEGYKGKPLKDECKANINKAQEEIDKLKKDNPGIDANNTKSYWNCTGTITPSPNQPIQPGKGTLGTDPAYGGPDKKSCLSSATSMPNAIQDFKSRAQNFCDASKVTCTASNVSCTFVSAVSRDKIGVKDGLPALCE